MSGPRGAIDARHRLGAAVRRLGLWRAYLAANILGIAAYFLLPSGGLAQALVLIVLETALLVALAVGLRRNRPAGGTFWTVLLAGQTVYLAAYVVWYVYPVAAGVTLPFPSLADALFILSYLIDAAALALLIRLRSGGTAADVLDTAVIALGLLTFLWVIEISGEYSQSGLGGLARVVSVSYPVLDLVLVSLVVRLFLGGGARGAAYWLLGLALAGQLTSDVVYAEVVLRGTFAFGTPLFLGWLLSFAFLGTAALHPSMRQLGSRVERRADGRIGRRLPGLLIAVLIGPAVLVVDSVRGVAGDNIFVAAVTATIFLLVLARVATLMAESARFNEEASRLALLVESSHDAIIGWALDGTITSWNAGAARLYGYSSAEVLGRRFDFSIPATRKPEGERMFGRVRAGEAVASFETEREHKDGRLLSVSVTLSPIRDSTGRVTGGATIARDISANRRIAALATARDQALDASRLKSEFLATMSHEIRTPMNGVIGLTRLLLDTPLDEIQRQYAEGVHSSGEALLAIINDILDFSKLEAGRVELEEVGFDPRRLVEEVAGLFVETARTRGIELVTHCSGDVPEGLRGDAGRLRQILSNLVSNALKFTSQGEVVVRAGVAGQRGGDRLPVRFEVTDTGIGISAADQTRLFEPFAQADASTTRRYGGTGLGLAISRRLAEAMGGEIGVESELGRGSTFWFSVPLAAHRGIARLPAPSAANLLRGLRVLVVDDNATNRLIVDAQLRDWEMLPEMAGDAQTGLELLRMAARSGHPHAVALLDVCMDGGMDGLSLAGTISADPGLAATAVVLLTSSMHVDAATARAAGVRARLTKPVRHSELYDTLVGLAAPVAASPPPVCGGKPTPAAEPARRRGRVLVAEDNAVNQMVAEGILASLGYEAEFVADGRAAVEAVSAGGHVAVLMDCHMPGMGGCEATREIRRREGASARIPIIAMTAAAMVDDRERCLAAGMDDYLAKPVDPAAVGAALNRLTGASGSTAAPAPAGPGAPAASGAAPLVGAAAVAEGARGSEPLESREDQGAVIDGDRLAVLRGLGPADGLGILPALVQGFLEALPARLSSLRRAVEEGNGDALVRDAHQLRGSAANIGAIVVADVCERLEAAGRGGESGGAAALVARLAVELARVEPVLERSLASAR